MKMPVLFVGHGSPMNAVNDNPFKEEWIRLGSQLKPKAILCVSAHWYTKGTRINPKETPEQIYDMYGFPPELYQVRYPAPGSPVLAERVKELLRDTVSFNVDWGIDHGTWSVLKWMFPHANIPIVQLSIDGTQTGSFHLGLGHELALLREEGILIIGSGNIVHNLRRIDWNSTGGYDWAYEFDGTIKAMIQAGQFEQIADYKALGPSAVLAVPTPDHFYPLLYVLGAADHSDAVHCFNESCELGSISMTGYLIG
ncbi:4,5-DOPA dioxygenase extradiol [anaerobic digester metagenome]